MRVYNIRNRWKIRSWVTENVVCKTVYGDHFIATNNPDRTTTVTQSFFIRFRNFSIYIVNFLGIREAYSCHTPN